MTAPASLPTAAAVFAAGLALGVGFALLLIARPASGWVVAGFFGALFCVAAGLDIRNTFRSLRPDPVDDEEADREADRYEKDWRRRGER